MPTYEYACASCDTNHEVVQSMADASLTECPDCGESGLRKLFSGVGIHFKGSGFYRTDSRDKKSSSTTETKKSDTTATKSADSSSTTSAAPATSSSSSSAAAST